jgi:Ca2+:H+ antiporter
MKHNTLHKNGILRYVLPFLAWAVFLVHEQFHLPFFNIIVIVMLLVAVLQAVHHAEVIAHRVGQPFGSMVLALAVTCIEVSLIISMMLAAGNESPAIARDTVFASIMIILTGMLGLSIFIGGVKYGEQSYLLKGVNASLITLVAISCLTLILPDFTKSTPGPYYTDNQLLFVALVSLVLYISFVFVQNFKHKDHFIADMETEQHHIPVILKPSAKHVLISTLLLFICLGAVTMLAESLAPDLDDVLDRFMLPHSIAGIVIASIVLMPEALSSLKASSSNQLQKSVNLSMGSALASIGLTIPIVAIVSIVSGHPLALGIEPISAILFVLALFTITLAFSTGQTSIMHGIVLMVIFATYIFMTVIP